MLMKIVKLVRVNLKKTNRIVRNAQWGGNRWEEKKKMSKCSYGLQTILTKELLL